MMDNLDLILENYRQLNNALKVSVKIDHEEVLKVVVEDLIAKRNSNGNKIRDAFDSVLLYYITPDEFESFVLKRNPVS